VTRIPAAEIERLKREVSIVELVKSYGVELGGSGDNLTAHCPLPGHHDRTPSLLLSPSKNLFNCLGKCSAGGDVIEWVKRMERVSFRQAVERLQAIAPKLTPRTPTSAPVITPQISPDEPDEVVLHRFASEIMPASFAQSIDAQAYVESRGLFDADLVKHFKLGFVGFSLQPHVASKYGKQGAAQRAQLMRIGLSRANGYPQFTSSVTIPVFGEDGEVLEIYGRKIKEQQRAGTSLHTYKPSRPDGRRGVFNLAAVKRSKELVWCESFFDALAFIKNGFHATSTSYGVSGFTREMRDAMLEHEVKRILIAYDADDAGDRGADELSRELGSEGIEVFRVKFPKGMDANEYALKMKPAPKALELVIGAAKWMAGPRTVAVPESLAVEPSSPVIEAAAAELRPDPSEAETPAAAPSCEPAQPCEPVLPLAADGASIEAPHADAAPSSATSEAAPVEEIRGDEIKIRLGDHRWRVRGLSKNKALDTLRVNLQLSVGDAFYLDTFDLHMPRARESFVREVSRELKIDEKRVKLDLAKIITRLDELAQRQLEALVKPERVRPPMTASARESAEELLKRPDLCAQIVADFKRLGVVGEEKNILITFFATLSRKLQKPLGIMIQSSSAAGKSALMDAALSVVPEEDREQYAALTSQSIYYMGEMNLSHKVLAVSEEQGLANATYALKLLQSEGVVSIASTGKDPVTGRLQTIPYLVRGPVMVFLTTTSMSVDEELSNRLITLTIDESAAQTSAIHALQREAQTLEGLLKSREREALVELYQNAQRLIEPLAIANPLASSLRFSNATARARRDHMKYLTLMKAIALAHQHQRSIREVEHLGEKLRYIEVTAADVALADELAKDVLGDGLDELPPQTRRLLEQIDAMVGARSKEEGVEKHAVRFSRRDVRRHTRSSDTVLRKHLGRLEELEYLAAIGGGARRKVTYTLAVGSKEDDLRSGEGFFAPPSLPLRSPGGSEDLSATSLENRKLRSPETKRDEGARGGRPSATLGAATLVVNGHAGTGATSSMPAKKAAS